MNFKVGFSNYNGEEINQLIKNKQWGTLVEIGEPAVEPLIESLRKIRISSFRFVLTTLGDIGDRRGVETLINFSNRPDYNISLSAIKSLGKIGDFRAVEPLIKALKIHNKYIRREAATALGMIGDQQAVEPLIECLSDPDKYLRHIAAKALYNIDDPRSTHALIGYMFKQKLFFGKERRNKIAKFLGFKTITSWAITVRDNYNWPRPNK